jgi:hypothetical protein
VTTETTSGPPAAENTTLRIVVDIVIGIAGEFGMFISDDLNGNEADVDDSVVFEALVGP